MWKDFKEFAMKGNVIDLAIGVIIGTAFNKIVTSLVNDLIMPIFGLFMGGEDFSGLKWTYKDTELLYGSFIQSIVDFLIIGLSLFFVVKVVNKLKEHREKKETDKKDEIPVIPRDEQLLMEIRDLLKQQTK